ncbi:MAG TPA: ABC transporter substrate binding protein, partial [Pyrinomonadaceae bacterium]|nr:ABC transporter substrate binding protein [Pyrinomonadaceae bacterium]
AQPATKRILILTGSDPNYPGFSLVTQRLRSTLRVGWSGRIEFLYELQEGLIQPPASPSDDEELASYLKRKYEGKNIDLIISAAAPRLVALLKNDPTLFAGIPKVFYEYEDEGERILGEAGPHATGVWAKLDYSQTLALALALHPDAHKVVVIGGNSSEEQARVTKARAEFRPYEGRAEFTYLTNLTLAELKEKLAALPKNCIVYFLSFNTDQAGDKYPPPEALSAIAPTSGAPIYGNSRTLFGAGLVGGNLIDLDAIGKRIGEVSLRILNGEKPEEIPPQTVPNATMFDWRELRRWGINESALPPGSVVLFKEPSFWELNKWYIIGGIAAIIAEGLLIAYLLIVQKRRRRAERERERFASQAEAEHRHLDEIVSNVPGIVWESMIDPKTDARKTTFISDYVAEMLGYTPEEWLSAPPGFGITLMPSEEDRERATRDSEKVISSGKNAVTRYRWRAKDGRVLWVESYLSPIADGGGKVVGLRGVSLDITEQMLAEVGRRHSEERNRAILQAIPDLMFLQTLDGVYLDYHAKDPKDLYLPPEDFIGKSVRDVLPPELAEKFLASFKLAEETGEPQVVEYDLALGEKRRWFEARIVRTVENILSVVRDVTERKESEMALH